MRKNRFQFEGTGKSLMQVVLENSISVLEPERDEIIESRIACEKSLHEYIRQAWHVIEPETPFVDGWVVGCVAEHLQALACLQIRNLLIAMPPRHNKSISCAVCLPTWDWAKKPGEQYIFGSYSTEFSKRDSLRSRRLIESEWYQKRWGKRFKLLDKGVMSLTNDHAGHRLAVSITGFGAGSGGSKLCFDDPLKPTDASSAAKRKGCIEWWTQTMNFRGNNPKTVCKLGLMQRLHRQDLIGHLMASGADYEILVLPAEYEPRRIFFTMADAKASDCRDPIVYTSLQIKRPELQDQRKDEGDPLWPERFTKENIEALKQEPTTISLGTSGQLQQRPADEKGTIFNSDDFRVCYSDKDEQGREVFVMGEDQEGFPAQRILFRICKFFQIADTAIQNNPKAKFTAVLTFVVAPMKRGDGKIVRNLIIFDAWKMRLEVREQLPALEQLRAGRAEFDVVKREWKVEGKSDPWPKKISIQAVEAKASGLGILQDARADGNPLEGLKAKDSKVSRAAQAVNLYRAGLLWHWSGMRNRGDLENELKDFPSGLYNDMVDCVGHGARKFFVDRLLSEFDVEPLAVSQAKKERAARGSSKIVVAGHEIDFGDED